MIRSRVALALAFSLSITFVATTSRATPRDECVEAHSRAQDLRERGQLSRARQLFVSCAQSSCPSLVQQDCARFGEELAQLVPTVTFSARDANAADLPLTTVYVDDALVASRLDDGRSYELDPGKHVVRYVHEGRETVLKVVLNQGERGRLLVATFVDRASPQRRDVREPPAEAAPAPDPRRPIFPLVIAGVGAAAAITGGVLFGLGTSSVPNGCSVSARECVSAPNDPMLGRAESSVRLANAGLALGIGGLVTMASGLVWYVVQPASSAGSGRGRIAAPWLTF
jgi:hypothetical protein